MHAHLLRPLLPAALATAALATADNAAKNEPASGPVQVRLAAFPRAAEAGPVILRSADGERTFAEATPLPASGFGPPLIVPARDFHIAPAPSADSPADGRPPHSADSGGLRVSLPAEGRAFLVALLSKPGGGAEVLPVRADDPRAGKGRFLLLNRSPNPVRLELANDPIKLRPGQKQWWAPPEDGTAARSFPVTMHVRSGNEWLRFAATRWVRNPSLRSYVFIFGDPANARVRYKVIEDTGDWIQ